MSSEFDAARQRTPAEDVAVRLRAAVLSRPSESTPIECPSCGCLKIQHNPPSMRWASCDDCKYEWEYA